MEPIVNLFRLRRSDQGTLGVLLFEEFYCYTMELPWRDNRRNISCIPPGEYATWFRVSPRFGPVYHVKNVPGRSYILIHPGNWAGDTSLGYRSHSNGCILVGQKSGVLLNQMAVLNSRITLRRFLERMEREPFTLRILETFPKE